MKKTITLTSFLLLVLADTTFGQDNKAAKQARLSHISRQLSVSDSKTQQLITIEDQYKTKAKALLANASLNETEKRREIDKLIADKNQQLKALLGEEAFNKWVPTTEREINEEPKK